MAGYSTPEPLRLVLYGLAVLFVGYLAWGRYKSNSKRKWWAPLRKQFDKYALIFATFVYTNFLVWHRTKTQSA